MTKSPFNAEFYWDERKDEISLLEVNPQISKSHCPLFEMVDGASHHEVMIDVALGRPPDFPYRHARYGVAAKLMLRVYEDGVVTRVPTSEFDGCFPTPGSALWSIAGSMSTAHTARPTSSASGAVK